MRHWINILREGIGTNDEYSSKGHADMKIKINDPRFGDNPLAYGDDSDDREDAVEELDEFDASLSGNRSKLDRLHDMLARAGVSDHEISLGINLTDEGKHKVAARLGGSPQEVDLLLQAIAQDVRDGDKLLAEAYRRLIAEEPMPPFHGAADTDDDRISAEDDALGNVNLQSLKTGKDRFVQGSQATSLRNKLLRTKDPKVQQAILRPLVNEEQDDDAPDSRHTGYRAEIESQSHGGSYNFVWTYQGHTGFATAGYGDETPDLVLTIVRTEGGDDIKPDPKMKAALLAQARDAIHRQV